MRMKSENIFHSSFFFQWFPLKKVSVGNKEEIKIKNEESPER